MKKMLTLCMVLKDNKILLGMKKRGFGEGRWNGFGGKVEEGESIEEAAMRELREEIGIEAKEMREVGILDFSFESDPKQLQVHVFKVVDYMNDPVESEEMRPQWFHIDKIPFEQMWSDDELWFPYMIEGKKFKGKFHFDRPSDSTYSAKIITQDIQEVS